ENPLTDSEGAERVREMIRSSRSLVASLVNCRPEEIFFVSSGTEANNWALKGAAFARKSGHLIISAIEHFSVLQTAQALERQGFELTIIPVESVGSVNPNRVAEAIKSTTILVAIQAGSDEIGTLQDLAAISDLKQQHPHILFHTD